MIVVFAGGAANACWKPGGDVELNDELIARYIVAYKRLRQIAPNLARQMANSDGTTPADIETGVQGFEQIEAAIKEAGFKDYAEFVRTNARIAWAFNQIQGRAFMGKMERMHQIGLEEIDAQLANPEVPEEAKAELRRARQEIIDNYEKNVPYAEGVLSVTENLTDKETIEVVARHRAALEEAYIGMKVEQVNEFMGRRLDE